MDMDTRALLFYIFVKLSMACIEEDTLYCVGVCFFWLCLQLASSSIL